VGFTDLPLLSQIKGRLSWLDERQRVIAENVVVEEQMLKMAESRMSYDAAIGFYQKSMQMLRMAARAPGR
jgi:flagellar basal-body rod protein FlgB